MRKRRVRALLMGGQACVFYGAAEFSRDVDLAILAEPGNLARLRRALAELDAEVIAVPPFEDKYLRRGHAIHFRCAHPEAPRLRVDIMSRMRGVGAFGNLWKRRTTIKMPGGITCDLLSLPDLVQAKKTQRDKDWPMIRRLVEAHYFANRANPNSAQISFWFQELRTPELLAELFQRYPAACRKLAARRPVLKAVMLDDSRAVDRDLIAEEKAERDRDRRYWLPLRSELEKLRHTKLRMVKRSASTKIKP